MADQAKGAADAAADAADEQGADKKRANPLGGILAILGNKVTFIVSLVVVEVIVAYFVVTALIEPRLAGEPVVKEEVKEEHAKPAAAHMFSIDNIVVNLNGSDGTRYLSAGIALEVDLGEEKMTEHQLEEMMPVLKHVIISVLSEMSVSEVSSTEGRERIRHAIKEQADHDIAPLVVHEIFFTEFVVQ